MQCNYVNYYYYSTFSLYLPFLFHLNFEYFILIFVLMKQSLLQRLILKLLIMILIHRLSLNSISFEFHTFDSNDDNSKYWDMTYLYSWIKKQNFKLIY